MALGVIVKELFESLAKKPATIKYPFEKVPVAERFRGRIHFDSKKCIGCSKCSIVCPAKAIEMVPDEKHTEVDFAGRKMARQRIPRCDLLVCIRCELCAEACPTKAIELTNKFSGCSGKREMFVTVE
ncbi:MAG: 4Fe-4S binding protein [Candidatus Diapherotrites archaeon]|nr:4Fe-4S binding protein [Candidatus Diapherotrites archaeon]